MFRVEKVLERFLKELGVNYSVVTDSPDGSFINSNVAPNQSILGLLSKVKECPRYAGRQELCRGGFRVTLGDIVVPNYPVTLTAVIRVYGHDDRIYKLTAAMQFARVYRDNGDVDLVYSVEDLRRSLSDNISDQSLRKESASV